MASIPNLAYTWRKAQHILVTTVTTTNLTGSYGSFTASTQSGSALSVKGFTIISGFTSTGSVSVGNIVVVSPEGNNKVTTGSANTQTPLGIAVIAGSGGSLIDIAVGGVWTFISSGSITRGQPVGINAQGLTRVEFNNTGSQILGIALDTGTAEGNIKVLIGPR